MITAEITDLKTDILRCLRHGHANAIRKDTLRKIIGSRDDRYLRQTIIELIKEGTPIVTAKTKPFGYFIADTPEEIKECMEKMKGYCIESAIHRRDLKRCLDKMQVNYSPVDGQYRLI